MINRNFLSYIGKRPLCKDCNNCAPKINGWVFVLCWRCSGLSFGFLLYLVAKNYIQVDIFTSIAIIAATGIEYVSQKLFKYRTPGFVRFLSGVLLVFCLASFIREILLIFNLK